MVQPGPPMGTPTGYGDPDAPSAVPSDEQRWASQDESHVRQVADFQVIESLGHGGSILLATPPARLTHVGRQVVLKVFPTEIATDDENAVRSISSALVSIAVVHSPYLVRLIEAGRNDGVFYYVMEYLPGGSLASPSLPLNMGDAVRAVANAARGAHDLHEAGIPHRNIRPSGIVLHESGAKLSDPGLASYLNPGMTLTGRLGIPEVDFISPDIIRGNPASRATDVWSLGATLHFVASGVSVFPHINRQNPVESLSEVLGTSPTIAEGLPGPIDAVVRACLEPAAPDRPTSAADLADRLDALWKR